jgi:NTP pyrophosphatase (non-canonical NTP hydrolase)
MDTGKVLGLVVDELERARDKFPHAQNTFAALIEEVGELGKALLEQDASAAADKCEDITAEAVQVATMALRLIMEGDNKYPKFSPTCGLRNYAPDK